MMITSVFQIEVGKSQIWQLEVEMGTFGIQVN